MKVFIDMKLENFDAWSGAVETKETILDNDMGEAFEDLVNELYPEGLSSTELNDLLLFEEEWIFKQLGIESED